jgi:hypothetical protein
MGPTVPELGNWRARMAVRGGALSHAVARAGWVMFAVLGAVLMIGLAVLYAVNPGDSGSDNAAAANFVGAAIVFAPIGAVLGGLVGLGAQFAVRSWLCTPTSAERVAIREAESHTARFVESGLRPSGRWARSFEKCTRSVTAFHAVAAMSPAGAGRAWFTGIGETLDGELSEALRLAKLGESLDTADGAELSETAQRIAGLLDAAEKSFAETTERAAAIALSLRDDSDFVRVRAQLDMLSEQAPQLRAEGIA